MIIDNPVPECFYRISVKALVLNETRDKFLITLETNGKWELPGGGLDWGTTPQEDLPREISEEMGLKIKWIANHPSYFLTGQVTDKTFWVANVVYETELESFNFTKSDECNEIKFINLEDAEQLPVFKNVIQLAEMFNPGLHTRE